MKQTTDAVPVKTAILMLIIGLVMGTVFTFIVSRRYEDVSREECLYLETQFLSCEAVESGRLFVRATDIAVESADGRYRIDDSAVTQELADALTALPPDTPIGLLLHPNGEQILEVSADGELLLDFETATAQTRSDRQGFLRLGLTMYGCALLGVFCLARKGKAAKE